MHFGQQLSRDSTMERTMYRTMKSKTGIGGQEIRQIVQRLREEPFNERYSLDTFDELQR